MKAGFDITRKTQAAAIMKKMEARIVRNAKEATQVCANILMEESIKQAPEDTGALKMSAYMGDEAEVIGTRVVSKFGFGKENDRFRDLVSKKTGKVVKLRRPFDYAIWVHEGIQSESGMDFIPKAMQIAIGPLRNRVREIMRKP